MKAFRLKAAGAGVAAKTSARPQAETSLPKDLADWCSMRRQSPPSFPTSIAASRSPGVTSAWPLIGPLVAAAGFNLLGRGQHADTSGHPTIQPATKGSESAPIGPRMRPPMGRNSGRGQCDGMAATGPIQVSHVPTPVPEPTDASHAAPPNARIVASALAISSSNNVAT